jgi:hypothetical protein
MEIGHHGLRKVLFYMKLKMSGCSRKCVLLLGLFLFQVKIFSKHGIYSGEDVQDTGHYTGLYRVCTQQPYLEPQIISGLQRCESHQTTAAGLRRPWSVVRRRGSDQHNYTCLRIQEERDYRDSRCRYLRSRHSTDA